MNLALWTKSFREGIWTLLGCGAVLFSIHWIRVWITSQFQMDRVSKFLEYAPDFITNMLRVPIEVIASPAGRVALAYDDPLLVVLLSVWAIARGSNAVSGEIDRGTMEMLLAQPVRRFEVLLSHVSFTVAGLAVLSLVCWLGTCAGLATIELEEKVTPAIFLPATLNLFALGVFLAGVTTFVSSCGRYRSRTIGIVVAFYCVQLIIKLLSIAVPRLEWLKYWTVLTAFDPQVLIHRFWKESLAVGGDWSWTLLVGYNGLLLGLGLVCYIVAAIVFCRRDLPAPL